MGNSTLCQLPGSDALLHGVERSVLHHTVYCHFHCGYLFIFPGKLRYLWGSDARQCCSLLNSWHSIHAAIHLKMLSALCTICHHKQQDVFPAWIITEVIFFFLCHWMVDFQNFLSASYVEKNTTYLERQAVLNKMPKNTVWPEFGGHLVSCCTCIPPRQSIPFLS